MPHQARLVDLSLTRKQLIGQASNVYIFMLLCGP